MNKPIMLDAGPLGRIAHPRPNPEISAWLQQVLDAGTEVIIPEIADYEVRRSLLLAGLDQSVERLDQLQQFLTYVPLDRNIMRKAAKLWAEARKAGQPTADPKELDGDVILAAQALATGAIVATENIGHLTRFVEARHWRNLVVQPPAQSLE
jgi:predicted nucleic acid-binding protein